MSARALDGIRVLELGESVGVAFCGRWLAAFGADVVKIEPPRGDWSRRYASAREQELDADSSALFYYLNTGKRGITMDLASTDPLARRALLELGCRSDILLHPYKPRELWQLGRSS